MNSMLSEIEKENIRSAKLLEKIMHQRKREKGMRPVRLDSKTWVLLPRKNITKSKIEECRKKYACENYTVSVISEKKKILTKERDSSIIELVRNGFSNRNIASKLGISESTVVRVKRKYVIR